MTINPTESGAHHSDGHTKALRWPSQLYTMLAPGSKTARKAGDTGNLIKMKGKQELGTTLYPEDHDTNP